MRQANLAENLPEQTPRWVAPHRAASTVPHDSAMQSTGVVSVGRIHNVKGARKTTCTTEFSIPGDVCGAQSVASDGSRKRNVSSFFDARMGDVKNGWTHCFWCPPLGLTLNLTPIPKF